MRNGNSTKRAVGWLSRCARVALVYPAIFLILLYGQWLLSWCFLGHPPVPSFDDPKMIDGSSWMSPITFAMFVSYTPMATVAFVLNVAYAVATPLPGKQLVKLSVSFVLYWAGSAAIMLLDPLSVLDWSLD